MLINDYDLFHGEADQYLTTMRDKSVQLIVASPPYNMGKEYEAQISIDHYLNSQEKTIKELHRVLAESGSICWQVGNYVKNGEVFPLDIFYYKIFKDLGMKLRNRIIWHFGHGLHCQKRLSGRYETILWFTKSNNYIFNLDAIRVPSKYPNKKHYKGLKRGELSGNPLGKNPSDIWEFMQNEWSSGFWSIPNVKFNHVEKNRSSLSVSDRASGTLHFSLNK